MLVEKVPATPARRSDTRTPRSSVPPSWVFRPAYVPPARNPLADVTPPPCTSSIIEAISHLWKCLQDPSNRRRQYSTATHYLKDTQAPMLRRPCPVGACDPHYVE